MSDNPAGWQPDPTGKHDHRYWDGTQWTDNVADAGVASTDPYEPVAEAPAEPQPAVASPDAPTAVTPLSGVDDTTAYPTAMPPPYVPPTPTATGGSGSDDGKRRLVIGGAILGLVVLAILAFLALGGDDDEPTDPLANEATSTTEEQDDDGGESLEDLRDDCEGGDFSACDNLYYSAEAGSELEEFGSTCGGITDPQEGLCAVSNGGEVPAGGLSDGDMGDVLEDAYQEMGLSEDQAECLTDRILEAIESGDMDQSAAMSQFFEYFADCDISMEDFSEN